MLKAEDIQALPDGMRGRYAMLEKGFGTEFWKFMQDWAMANSNEAAVRVLNAQTWEQHLVATGMRMAYLEMANQEQIVSAQFTAMVDTAKAEKATAVEDEALELEEVNE